MLLTMIYLFLLVSVVLLLNLLIAQLNQTYEYINKDSNPQRAGQGYMMARHGVGNSTSGALQWQHPFSLFQIQSGSRTIDLLPCLCRPTS